MGRTFVLAAGFVFFWNSGFVGAEYALPNAGPFTLLFWRYWALTLLLGFVLWFRGGLRWPGCGEVLATGVIGILAHGVWLGCVFFSLDAGVPAGIVALVVALQPLVTGAFSGLVTRESTPLVGWAGLLLGFVGVGIAVGGRIDFSSAESLFNYLVPFGSVVAITAATLYQRRRELRHSADPPSVGLVLFYQSLATALATTAPAVWAEGLETEWTAGFVLSMLWLVVAVSLLAYALMWMLVARINATRVASLFYLGPPVTMVMAGVAFGDRLSAGDVLGLVIVMAGVLLAQKSGRKSGGASGAGL